MTRLSSSLLGSVILMTLLIYSLHLLNFIIIMIWDVKENPVLIYMKGVPKFPQHGFSSLAARVLKLNSWCINYPILSYADYEALSYTDI
ncbi:hypothetical protein EUGRSUZ_D00994 [Eucalyptus grandis]|uniref:Uncharacterized protein n=2 Tax=Eucalyptus grandis TaxID=71139 RepID=A0A059CFA4_EUCGR|nr:hypothetical protein EUGRSUZ_D00994 [Eucalyptus grandis]